MIYNFCACLVDATVSMPLVVRIDATDLEDTVDATE